jgi:hypothetical protein
MSKTTSTIILSIAMVKVSLLAVGAFVAASLVNV